MTTPAPHRALTPPEQLDEFVRAVKPALDPIATYDHGPMGGHAWRWSTPAGVWALHVGGAIDAGPIITGPAGQWHTSEYTMRHADLVLLMLQLAGALEGRPQQPTAKWAANLALPADRVISRQEAAERMGINLAALDAQHPRHLDDRPASIVDAIPAGGDHIRQPGRLLAMSPEPDDDETVGPAR